MMSSTNHYGTQRQVELADLQRLFWLLQHPDRHFRLPIALRGGVAATGPKFFSQMSREVQQCIAALEGRKSFTPRWRAGALQRDIATLLGVANE